jgi:hypothetical protein
MPRLQYFALNTIYGGGVGSARCVEALEPDGLWSVYKVLFIQYALLLQDPGNMFLFQLRVTYSVNNLTGYDWTR